jgi:hypothetical protein
MAVLIWPKPGAADRLGHCLHQWRSLEHAPGHGIGLALNGSEMSQKSKSA